MRSSSPAVGPFFPFFCVSSRLSFTPSSCAFDPHEGYASVPLLVLRETACGNRRVSNPCSFTSSGTLRGDCTPSRRGALSVVALFRAYVPPRLSSRSGCALDSPESLRVQGLSCSCSRRCWSLCLWSVRTSRPCHASVVKHACAAVAVAHGRRVHERREALPGAARGTCCACWGHLCAVVLAGPDLHGLAGFPPLDPDLKCFRPPLEWRSSKLAVRRSLLNPVLTSVWCCTSKPRERRSQMACVWGLF